MEFIIMGMYNVKFFVLISEQHKGFGINANILETNILNLLLQFY